MREESHLDEMRSAIRGDFERLAERRGDQELMRVADGEPEPTTVGVPADEQPPSLTVVLPPAPVVDEPEPLPESEVDEEVAPQRSWLARFFSP